MPTIKNILLVTIITALVWIFAESETLRTSDVRLELQLIADATGQRIARPQDEAGWSSGVTLELSGAAGRMDNIQALALRPVRLAPGQAGIPAEPGEYTIDLRQTLAAIPDLTGRGISITRCEPASIRIRVDEIVSREFKIVVAANAELEGPPEVRPAAAVMTMPRHVADAIPAGATLTARIDADTLARLVPGRREVISNVRLELSDARPGTHPDAAATRLEPATAQVALTLRARSATTELASVPVQVRVAPIELARWDITIPEQDRFVSNVRVSGPADLIDQVKRGEIKITATLPLSFEELERGITSKEVIFSDLPSSLKVEADNRSVKLSVKRRGS
ncbi:MAG: hypothetical protein SFY96_04105 [Planctomycetota bacterium]|nr:hypothetical protein [Planctomycetota bacterium]